jgi:negative regulator of flagellin synthesis FlgM
MSYTDGIGPPQQAVSSITTGETQGPQQTTAVQGSGGRSATNASSGAQADHTSLSETSSLIAQALNTDDVRSERVAALRESIAAGTYSVSSSDVADKLISTLLK